MGVGHVIAARCAELGLTQADLATALNTISGRVTLTRNEISRWERGSVTPRSWLPHLATALEVPLRQLRVAVQESTWPPAGADVVAQTATLAAARATVADDDAAGTRGSDDVRRQAFLRAVAATMAAAAGEPIAELLARASSAKGPSRVGASDVRQVDQAINLFGQWQDLYGGGACEDAIAGQVRWATALLDADATDQVKQDLYRSVGFLADVAGWGAFDAGHHDAARAYFREALWCAERADDWSLRANVLSDMARQAMYVGRPDDGLSLIELAQVRRDRQTPTVRAMLSGVHARAMAALGDGEQCYRAVVTAEDDFAGRNPADDPPWITYFDEADLAGDTGDALLDVALDGRRIDDARDRLRHSARAYEAGQARGRALAVGKLAILELSVGDLDQGIVYGEQALEAQSRLQSRRAKDDLVKISKALPRRHHPGAGELRLRIDETLGASRIS